MNKNVKENFKSKVTNFKLMAEFIIHFIKTFLQLKKNTFD